MPATCFFIDSNFFSDVKCENKCTKERSIFPCYRVTVMYQPLPVAKTSSVKNRTTSTIAVGESSKKRVGKIEPARRYKAYLYDYHSTMDEYGFYKVGFGF